ncbi:MAG: hypothetical protein K5879_08145 [Lachnospiraceae bacterium]|nr:hypothetical protein [Lachnospiraceae bacterium]
MKEERKYKFGDIILANRIRCLKCGDIIESENVHDFRWCQCKSCAVDGGHDYLRRVGNKENWEDLSIVSKEEEINGKSDE